MQFYAIGQTEYTIYQNFSKEQLQIDELQQIAKILPQAESYYYQNIQKDSIIKEQNQIITNLLIAIDKEKEKEKIYLKQIELKNKEIEIIKPKWWQNPLVIVCEIFISFIIGISLTN